MSCPITNINKLLMLCGLKCGLQYKIGLINIDNNLMMILVFSVTGLKFYVTRDVKLFIGNFQKNKVCN